MHRMIEFLYPSQKNQYQPKLKIIPNEEKKTGLSLFVPPLPDTRLFVGCSESTIEHNIIFPDVRNENCWDVRNEKYRMFGTKSAGCSEQKVTDVRNGKIQDVRKRKWQMIGTKNDGCSEYILAFVFWHGSFV